MGAANKDQCVICVAGSRGFTDYSYLKITLWDYLYDREFFKDEYCIITGDAKGTDSLAVQFAKEWEANHTVYKADWKTHGKVAGPIRNSEMIKEADVLIAFWDGKSKGTKDSITKAINKGIESHIYII